VKWYKLIGRRFFDRKLELTSSEDVQGQLERLLPPPKEMKDAIGRLTLTYPREWEAFVDEPAIRRYAQDAFEFHFIRHAQLKIGARVPNEESLLGKNASDQLDYYWKNLGLSDENGKELKPLAEKIMAEVNNHLIADTSGDPT
jgi:hypothetical protein